MHMLFSKNSFLGNIIKSAFPFIDFIEEVSSQSVNGIYIHPYSFNQNHIPYNKNGFQIVCVGKKLTPEQFETFEEKGAKFQKVYSLPVENKEDIREYISYDFFID